MDVLKNTVMLLVLANVAYFLYAHGVARPPSSPQPQSSGVSLKFPAARPSADTAGGSPPSAHAGVAGCASVGPFSELAEVARAELTLRGGGHAPHQRASDAEVPDGVLIYLPMPETPASTAQLRRELRAAGIAEVPDVPGPNQTPVVSLGAFSDPQRAKSWLAMMRKAGFSPQTMERKRSATVFWLDVDLNPEDASLNPADLHAEVKACMAPGAAFAGETSGTASAAR